MSLGRTHTVTLQTEQIVGTASPRPCDSCGSQVYEKYFETGPLAVAPGRRPGNPWNEMEPTNYSNGELGQKRRVERSGVGRGSFEGIRPGFAGFSSSEDRCSLSDSMWITANPNQLAEKEFYGRSTFQGRLLGFQAQGLYHWAKWLMLLVIILLKKWPTFPMNGKSMQYLPFIDPAMSFNPRTT